MAVTSMALETKLEVREVQATVMNTMLLDVEMPAVVAGLDEGTAFSNETRERPGEAVGSPHIKIAVAFLLALSEDPLTDPTFKEGMLKWWILDVKDKSEVQVARAISIFKLKRPGHQKEESSDSAMTGPEGSGGALEGRDKHSKPYAKMTICFQHAEFQAGLIQELGRRGGRLMSGVAPKGRGEREVMKLLKKLRAS